MDSVRRHYNRTVVDKRFIRYPFMFFENGIIGNIGILENWFRVLYNSNIPGGEITQFI
jgi:hypothetical protein